MSGHEGVSERTEAPDGLLQQGSGRGLLPEQADSVRQSVPGDVHGARPERRLELRISRQRVGGRQQRHGVHRGVHSSWTEEPPPHARPVRRRVVHGQRTLPVGRAGREQQEPGPEQHVRHRPQRRDHRHQDRPEQHVQGDLPHHLRVRIQQQRILVLRDRAEDVHGPAQAVHLEVGSRVPEGRPVLFLHRSAVGVSDGPGRHGLQPRPGRLRGQARVGAGQVSRDIGARQCSVCRVREVERRGGHIQQAEPQLGSVCVCFVCRAQEIHAEHTALF